MALVLVACSPTYTRGCSTQQESVITHGPIVIRELANPYQAAKGRRLLRWCEIEINGRSLRSPEGTRAAQMCSASPAPDVEAVTYAWQHETGTSGGFLLDLTGGRHVEHALHGGGGWAAGGVHDFPARVWNFNAAPDGSAVFARGERTGTTTPVFVMRLPGGHVEAQSLVNAEHQWIDKPTGSAAEFDKHVHWVRQADGAHAIAVDP